ncbi:MAG: serine/threonine-protein kinase [Enhygromyxa sp.]
MSEALGQPSDADATLISGDSVVGEVVGMGRLAPGKTFAERYLLLVRLGAGEAGIVYAAHDSRLDRKVAIKLLRPPIGDRIARAAERTAAISHPNILAVHELGSVHEVAFVVMELVEGGSLREWLDASPHPWPLALELFRKIGAGLAAAHRGGLIHGDFRPSSVLLTEQLDPRIADFGVADAIDDSRPAKRGAARRLDEAADALTAPLSPTEQRRGAWAYHAPEREPDQPADAGADQFGFCVALYEALYGERPFEGTSLRAIASAIAEGRVKQPQGSKVPAWLRGVVLRGLAHDPRQRWPSMDALLEALEHGQKSPRRRLAAGLGVFIIVLTAALATAQCSRSEDSSHLDPPKAEFDP